MTQAIPVAKKRLRRINPALERTFSLHEFGKAIDPPVHYDTVLRWVNDGVKSAQGKTVFLETIHATRGRRSSLEAYFRFLDAMNDD